MAGKEISAGNSWQIWLRDDGAVLDEKPFGSRQIVNNQRPLQAAKRIKLVSGASDDTKIC